MPYIQPPDLLFCFGLPKSGTTYLQMILDRHPEISCPSEHQFEFFAQRLPKILEQYNKLIQLVDDRTARQGPCFFNGQDVDEIFKKIIELAAKRGARGKMVKWYALNDNGVLNRLKAFITLFPQSKFLFIVRDPRAVTVSSWHHNMRIEENFLERAKDLAHWASMIATWWKDAVQQVLDLNEHNDKNKILMVRYEDLRTNAYEHIKKLFSLLDVASDRQLIDIILSKTSINKFKKNPFFRKGSVDEWKSALPFEAKEKIKEIALDQMKHFNYV